MNKIKTTEKHFNLFKEECLRWQNLFELHNWELHFKWEATESARASINYTLTGYVASLFLAKEWANYEEILDKDIEMVAKHEMIHLLIGRLEQVGSVRFASEDELSEAEEELVRKLEYII